ncbi:glycoside hydrolase family protein [Sphingomonas phyllosphaerae]|uniref:glycoside hydrolase family protein n=1 Tax=Sphingomonas phyllosphaerae TaxID=257003 RepID=UPI000422C9A3|nr:glycoside hydrolase family protein [Sphingomonas phyllosphaerae]
MTTPVIRTGAQLAALPPATYDRVKLVAELVRDEGEKLRVYRCTEGKRTIGVGRNLDAVGITPAEQRTLGLTVGICVLTGITPAQSRALLANDIDAAERALDRRWPWWRRMNAPRQRVLLNMCFNMGPARLATFVQALARMEEGDFGRAAIAMLASLWATQVGGRSIRLATMMRTGRDFA